MEYVYYRGDSRIRNLRNINQKNKNLNLNKILRIIAISMILLIIFFNTTFAKQNITKKEIIIKNGQTIWNIANEICNENNNLKVQNVVLDIKKINNLESSVIYENQKLLVYEY